MWTGADWPAAASSREVRAVIIYRLMCVAAGPEHFVIWPLIVHMRDLIVARLVPRTYILLSGGQLPSTHSCVDVPAANDISIRGVQMDCTARALCRLLIENEVMYGMKCTRTRPSAVHMANKISPKDSENSSCFLKKSSSICFNKMSERDSENSSCIFKKSNSICFEYLAQSWKHYRVFENMDELELELILVHFHFVPSKDSNFIFPFLSTMLFYSIIYHLLLTLCRRPWWNNSIRSDHESENVINVRRS